MTTELSEASAFELHMEDSCRFKLFLWQCFHSGILFILLFKEVFYQTTSWSEWVNKITSKSLPKLRNVNVNIATFEGALLLLPLFSIKTLLKLFKSQHSTPLIQLYSAWLDIEIRKLPSTYKFVWGRGKVRPHNLFYYDSEK